MRLLWPWYCIIVKVKCIVHCLYQVFMRSAVFNYPEISDTYFRVVEYVYIGLGLDIHTTVQYYTKQCHENDVAYSM